MKKHFSTVLTVMILACQGQTGNVQGITNDSTKATISNEGPLSASAESNCGHNLLFRKGTEIHASSYNGQGKELSKQVSKVTKVYQEGMMTIAELEMKTNTENANEQLINARYKCEGKLFYVDLASFLSDAQTTNKIETSGLQFPFEVSVGETLPDVDYTITMNAGGTPQKITSHMKERKVEAKESVTTPAGTFECFRISSVVETDIDMPGMDEKRKKMMEEMKKKMGKNKMTCWFAPNVTIIKMELHMGDKLVTRSEVTSIKK